jgi:predicted Zn-dependent protease
MAARLRSLLTLPRRRPLLALATALALGLLGLGAHQAGWYWYAESHRRAAERALARYEWDEAQEHLAACLRARPRSAPFHFQMARAARRAGRYGRAAEHLEACERLAGVTAATALEWAMLRAAQGELADNERYLQGQADRGPPEGPLALEALAQGYIRAYRLGNARDCLDRLLQREPEHVRALLWRGALRQSAQDDAGAEADFRRAVEALPDHAGARCRLGELLLRQARAKEALRQYEHLRPRPGGDQPAVLLGLARSHRQLGATDAARQALDELLARQPDHAEALLERGRLALADEPPAESERWLRRAVTASPFSAPANWALAQSLRRQGKGDEARQYEAAHDGAVRDRKRLEEALVRVGKAPADPAPRREAGLICLRTGKEREGLRWLFSALAQAPRDGPTHAALADYYAQAGQPGLAAKHRRLAEQAGAAAPSP